MLDSGHPYWHSSGEATEKKSLVVFVDILGYESLVLEAIKHGQSQRALRALRRALDEAFEEVTPEAHSGFAAPNTRFWEVKAFTDNLVLAHPITSGNKEGEDELGSVLLSMITFQQAMIRHGYVVRGGMAIGKAYVDRDIVWGKALLDAYHFEAQKGTPPWIAVGSVNDPESSSSFLAHVFLHFSYYGTPHGAPQNRELLIDSTRGVVFVDYLSGYVDADGDGTSDEVNLELHRDLIAGWLTEYAANDDLRRKYEWLAEYHNFCIGEYRHLSKALLIPGLSLGAPTEFKRFSDLYTSAAKIREIADRLRGATGGRPKV